MNVPWLLCALGLTAIGFLIFDPIQLVWLLLFSPILIVLVPVVFPPVERRLNRAIDEGRARRRLMKETHKTRGVATDPTAGLSFPRDDGSGGLSVSEADADSQPSDESHESAVGRP